MKEDHCVVLVLLLAVWWSKLPLIAAISVFMMSPRRMAEWMDGWIFCHSEVVEVTGLIWPLKLQPLFSISAFFIFFIIWVKCFQNDSVSSLCFFLSSFIFNDNVKLCSYMCETCNCFVSALQSQRCVHIMLMLLTFAYICHARSAIFLSFVHIPFPLTS